MDLRKAIKRTAVASPKLPEDVVLLGKAVDLTGHSMHGNEKDGSQIKDYDLKDRSGS
jgi:hypothetical protein